MEQATGERAILEGAGCPSVFFEFGEGDVFLGVACLIFCAKDRKTCGREGKKSQCADLWVLFLIKEREGRGVGKVVEVEEVHAFLVDLFGAEDAACVEKEGACVLSAGFVAEVAEIIATFGEQDGFFFVEASIADAVDIDVFAEGVGEEDAIFPLHDLAL